MNDLRGRYNGTFGDRRNGLDDIVGLVLHHTAADADSTPADLERLHVQINGWGGIGYHAQIQLDGTLNLIGDLRTLRAHVAKRNHEFVGLVLNGNLDSPGEPRAEQIETAGWYYAVLQQAVGRALPLAGHRDVAPPDWPTACPGARWPAWRQAVLLTSGMADVGKDDIQLLRRAF